MRIKLLVLLTFYFEFSKSQSSLSSIESSLADANNARIITERNIWEIFSDFANDIGNCSAAIKAQNGPTEVISTLNSFKTFMIQISSIKNFETYKNSSACADINMKISSLDMDQTKLGTIREKITQNMTAIYKAQGKVLRAYQLNAGKLGAQASAVIKIVTDVPSTLSVLRMYQTSLSTDITNLNSYKTTLNSNKKTYCPCPSGKTLSGTSTLEANIQVRKFWNFINKF